MIIKVCLLVRPTTIRLRCRQQPSLSPSLVTRKQEISCAEIKERRTQPQPTASSSWTTPDASTTITSSRRKYSTVYAFYEQRITRNLILISFWVVSQLGSGIHAPFRSRAELVSGVVSRECHGRPLSLSAPSSSPAPNPTRGLQDICKLPFHLH